MNKHIVAKAFTMVLLLSGPASAVARQPGELDSLRTVLGRRLGEVVVAGNRTARGTQMKSAQSVVNLDRNYMEDHFAGSLMQSLADIPGVRAMTIGSGQAKPVIRGLGFNRVAVMVNGIKHEGQQWGDDHGLEVDPFGADRVEIVKGPGALLYGSDAIGGVMNLYNTVPVKAFEGRVNMFARSNNASLGTSVRIEGRGKHFFYKAGGTYMDYADYKIPADSIEYYSYNIRLKDRTVRNTAGCERDADVAVGYEGDGWKTFFQVSDAYARSGFFANAHGLEVRLSDIDYDSSRRDVDLPCQSVNHLTLMNHTDIRVGRTVLTWDLAYQNNVRKELSEPVSHGYMPKPGGTLERKFRKDTWSANLHATMAIAVRHSLSVGMNGELQHNRRGGWGFVIPDFDAVTVGAYALDRYRMTDRLVVTAGARYDRGHTRIRSYRDWYKTPVKGTPDSIYMQRSADLARHFGSVTWAAGVNYAAGRWNLKANIGKSYRMPIAKELGTDGINYNIFRYERGNPDLKTEQAYEVDAGINWHSETLDVQVDPYLSYFPNYIYLCPTPEYREGLQLCEYTQCRVVRCGLEAEVTWMFLPGWQLRASGDYLHARQASGPKRGYALPFSPAPSATLGLRYAFRNSEGEEKGHLAVTAHAVAGQHDIVPPEEVTPGHCSFDASAGWDFRFGKCRMKAGLQAQNLLDRRYYDHTSYYRLLDVPETGRNVSLMLSLRF